MIARSILSLGMFSARAAITAARRRGVHVGIGQAHFGRHGDFAGELEKSLSGARPAALAVHDVLELTMPGHRPPLLLKPRLFRGARAAHIRRAAPEIKKAPPQGGTPHHAPRRQLPPRTSQSPRIRCAAASRFPASLPKSEAEDPQAGLARATPFGQPRLSRGLRGSGFPRLDAARSARLDLEYLKPELQLQGHGVTDAIVVFGSTRLVEPKAAAARLERRDEAAADPQDAARAQTARRAERIVEKSRYYEVARQFGALVAPRSSPAEAGSRS